MFKLFVRGISALAVSALLLAPETSQACCLCDWCDWFKPKPVTYAPPPACAVCPQQVSYVPQTSYRTEYSCVPCTTCQAVNTCDPCGGAQTVMQPVTSYVRRPVMVPYTTYRPVVTQLNYAAPACTTCGAAYSSPYYTGAAAMTSAVAAPSGCATCGGGSNVAYGAATVPTPTVPSPMYATPGYAAPGYAAPGYATPGYAAQPSLVAPPTSAAGMAAPSMGTPTPAPPSMTAPNTFQPSSASPPSNSSLMPTTPIPDNDKFNSGNAPRLLDPQTRTTSAEMMGPVNVTHAVFNTADREYVFHPAGYPSTGKEQLQNSNDGWSAGSLNNSSTDGWQPTDGR